MLRSGLKNAHIFVVCGLCFFCDIVLMTIGVFGLGTWVASSKTMSVLLALGGALFLLVYASISLNSAIRGGKALDFSKNADSQSSEENLPQGETPQSDLSQQQNNLGQHDWSQSDLSQQQNNLGQHDFGQRQISSLEQETSLAKTILLTLSVTLLNPHVYIDTVVIIGGIAGTLQAHDKFLFLIGALISSALWFYSLGYGARLLIPLFRKKITWRILDLGIAALMVWIAIGLIRFALGN